MSDDGLDDLMITLFQAFINEVFLSEFVIEYIYNDILKYSSCMQEHVTQNIWGLIRPAAHSIICESEEMWTLTTEIWNIFALQNDFAHDRLVGLLQDFIQTRFKEH